MKNKLTSISFILVIILVIVLVYQLYVAKTLLNIQQERDFLSVESQFEQLAYRSDRIVEDWDDQDSDASTILMNEFIRAEGLLWGRPATKYYEVGIGIHSNANFTSLAEFLTHYYRTVSNDLEKLESGDRSTKLKERVTMISKDMEFLSEHMNRETLHEFSNYYDFYKHWSNLKEELKNKEAANW
ncbi:hypothetical protein [Aquibacillus sediminis]|uniref:hypothetical protein n=1 Tax=Aquibacillus sediminis TaxID=2574734 RepID=UPI001109584A|nr:hypothetical protein [Aquibacillus sediminis]